MPYENRSMMQGFNSVPDWT